MQTNRANTFVQIANIDTFAKRQSSYVRRMADKIDIYTRVDKVDISAIRTRRISIKNDFYHMINIQKRIRLTRCTKIYHVIKENIFDRTYSL